MWRSARGKQSTGGILWLDAADSSPIAGGEPAILDWRVRGGGRCLESIITRLLLPKFRLL